MKDGEFIDEFSITENLTEEERKTIKEMNAEAMERSASSAKMIKQELFGQYEKEKRLDFIPKRLF